MYKNHLGFAQLSLSISRRELNGKQEKAGDGTKGHLFTGTPQIKKKVYLNFVSRIVADRMQNKGCKPMHIYLGVSLLKHSVSYF